MPSAGYSGTPLPKKLGIKPGSTLTLVRAPDGFDRTLGKLPDDVRVKRARRGATEELCGGDYDVAGPAVDARPSRAVEVVVSVVVFQHERWSEKRTF